MWTHAEQTLECILIKRYTGVAYDKFSWVEGQGNWQMWGALLYLGNEMQLVACKPCEAWSPR